MQYLKADTEITVRIGPFLDQTSGYEAETGLTITQPDVRLSKAGGDFAQKNAAETLVHDENGWYILTLDATDTNTEGRLDVAIHESGALPVWREFMVVNANVFDSLFAAATTDYLQVDTTQIAGAAVNAASAQIGANIVNIAGAAVNTATAQVGANVVTQADIDFGNTQKASIGTAVNGQLTAANTELAAVPTTVSGLRAMVQFLFETLRNRKTLNKDTGVETLYKEDAAATLGTATHSTDGTTIDRGEMN